MRKSAGWHQSTRLPVAIGPILHLLWAAVQVQTTSFPDWNCFPPSTSSTFGLKGASVWQVSTVPITHLGSFVFSAFFLKCCPLRLQLSGSRSCNCRSTLAMRSRKPRWGEGRQVPKLYIRHMPHMHRICHYDPIMSLCECSITRNSGFCVRNSPPE